MTLPDHQHLLVSSMHHELGLYKIGNRCSQGFDFPGAKDAKEAVQAKKGQFFQSAPKPTSSNKVGVVTT